MDTKAARGNLETVMTWLDAMRREDLDGAVACFAPEVVWEGLVPGVDCRDRDAVRQMLEESIRESRDVDHLELTAGAQRVVLGVRSPQFEELAGVTLNGELFNVFTIEGGRIVHVRDFADPHEAHGAAGVSESVAGQ